MDELKTIMKKFASSGWDLIAVPAQQWLDGKVTMIHQYRQLSRLTKNVELAAVNQIHYIKEHWNFYKSTAEPILPIYHVVIQHLLSADYISSACNKRKHYVR